MTLRVRRPRTRRWLTVGLAVPLALAVVLPAAALSGDPAPDPGSPGTVVPPGDPSTEPAAASPAAPVPSPSCSGDPDPVTVLVCQLLAATPLRPPPPVRPAPAPRPPAASPPPSPTASSPAPLPPAALLPAPPSLQELIDILLHPLSADRPALAHFRPDADPAWATLHAALGPAEAAPAPVAAPALASRPAHRDLGPVHEASIAAGLLLLVLVVVFGGAPPPLTTLRAGLLRARRIAAGALLLAVCLVPPSSFSFRTSSSVPLPAHPAALDTGTTGGTMVATEGTVGVVAVAPPATAWAELEAVERSIAFSRHALVREETLIRHLAVLVAAHLRSRDGPVSTGEAGALRGEAIALDRLVVAHRATVAAYDRGLAAEYAAYHGAAIDPVRRRELLSGAAASADPGATAAVRRDLDVVGARVAQERAIAAVVERLADIDRLDPAQLAAIRGHARLIAPEIAPVSQWFGPTELSIEPPLSYGGVFYRHFHTGIDIAAPLDTPVHAAADGVVVLATRSVDAAGRYVGYGNYVVIAHPGGMLTLYAHLDRILVQAGDVLRQGQPLGLEGSTGWSTGPHVHFEVRQAGLLLDPAAFVAGQLSSS